MVVPITRMDVAVEKLAFCAPLRSSLANVAFDFDRLNLRSYEPRVRDRLLIVKAEHDLFADPDAIEELARQWNPEVWRIPHGHISALFSLPLMTRTAAWFGKKFFGEHAAARSLEEPQEALRSRS
jgi:hypothetical protein